MAKKHDKNRTNQPSQDGRGNPGDTGQSKEETKTVYKTEEEIQREEELREEYMEDGDIAGDQKVGSHPNRNTRKTSIDKPPYS